MVSVFLLYKNEMSAKRSGIQNHNRQVCCMLSYQLQKTVLTSYLFFYDQDSRQSLLELFKVDIQTKKAWEPVLLLVPHIEALALPCQSKRATLKAPRCVSKTDISAGHTRHHEPMKPYNTPHWGVPVALFLTNSCELARFQYVKTKA